MAPAGRCRWSTSTEVDPDPTVRLTGGRALAAPQRRYGWSPPSQRQAARRGVVEMIAGPLPSRLVSVAAAGCARISGICLTMLVTWSAGAGQGLSSIGP
ncbi:hypothetical protein MILUP08_40350 [Micromonospora lupini str. Lupac 08]|uniref:Uncharacterized protein n=1 Tax=Micromonospora lupini str. Lupac 08 TaxID=1150864 RepID=I0KV47_9ACTN|nr:hypothetical protein MILUP08_40350 [Micromonospora lupini str. Lupac 08]